MTSEERPYERFERFGAANLTDAELLAVILRTGTREHDALDLARAVLGNSGNSLSLGAFERLTMPELLKIPGIGKIKATKILCLSELSRRISRVQTAESLSFRDAESIYRYYGPMLRCKERENLFMLMLDNRLHLIREEIISVGTVNSTLISVREIFLCALRAQAVYVILLHNHPSGDPSPSAEDISATEKIRQAGNLLEIRLLDHIVVGEGYCSLREMGLLSEHRS